MQSRNESFIISALFVLLTTKIFLHLFPLKVIDLFTKYLIQTVV